MAETNELIHIPLGRGCELCLYRQEILKGLPQELLIRGSKRAKAIARREERERRLRSKFVSHSMDEESALVYPKGKAIRRDAGICLSQTGIKVV